MPRHKITMVFGPGTIASRNIEDSTAGSLHSWTESWYHNEDITNADSMIVARSLVLLRRAILTAGWRVISVRAAIFPSSRAVVRLNLPPADGTGRYTA